jgi:hypothetical protein
VGVDLPYIMANLVCSPMPKSGQKKSLDLSPTSSLTEDDWKKLYEEHDANRFSVSALAMRWGIPRTTLICRLKNRRCENTAKAVGAPSTLCTAAEAEISSHLIHMAEGGYALTKKKVRKLLRSAAEKFDVGEKLGGRSHLRGFLRRHEDLAARTVKYTNDARATRFNRVTVTKWFTVFKEIVAQYAPNEIFNADDKFFNTEEMLPKHVCAAHMLHTIGRTLMPCAGDCCSQR